MIKTTTRLRELLKRPGALVVPGVYDALSARICEMAGFEAVFHSGYGTAAAVLGLPDIGLLTLTEMAAQVKAISRSVRIPVFGDSDNGFGNGNAFVAVHVLWLRVEACISGRCDLLGCHGFAVHRLHPIGLASSPR